jgi:hypothetical protein
MNELFSPPSFNINNINIPEEFGLSRELFFFDNPGKWQQLKEQYTTACDYLTRALEPSQKSWARCYTATTFVAGVQLTQRVEGYNSVIKRVVNGNTTLWQLAQYLNERISIEMQKIEYLGFKDSNALVGLLNLATQLFPRIDQMIKTYLTPELLSLQHAQMNQATLYYCRQLAINETYIAKHVSKI